MEFRDDRSRWDKECYGLQLAKIEGVDYTLAELISLYVISKRSIDDAKKVFAAAELTGECRRVPDTVLVDAKQVMLQDELGRSLDGDKKAKKA